MKEAIKSNPYPMDKETKEFVKSEIEGLAQIITRSFDGLNRQIDARFTKRVCEKDSWMKSTGCRKGI